MPTAFVTGANGFLGATLVRQLLAEGWQVRALLRPGANDLLLRDLPAIERVEGDLLHPLGYRAALAGCGALFHTAAAHTHDPARLAEMEVVNVEGTKQVLMSALATGVTRIVHTSTIGTIGQPEDGSLANEETPFNLPTPSAYVRSKLLAEQLALQMAANGAPIVVVHPAALLGAGDWRPSASGRRFLDAAQDKSGWRQRYPAGGVNWTPVSDAARGLILAVERGQAGRRYLLGHCDGNLDAEAFFRLLAQACSAQPSPGGWGRLRDRARRLLPVRSSAPANPGPARLSCDPTRAVVELGLPQTSLLAAAQAEYAWYREHGYL